MRGGLCLPSWRPIRPLGRQIKSALFGLGLKSEVMGVALPKLSHTEELVVDCYKPGVLL